MQSHQAALKGLSQDFVIREEPQGRPGFRVPGNACKSLWPGNASKPPSPAYLVGPTIFHPSVLSRQFHDQFQTQQPCGKCGWGRGQIRRHPRCFESPASIQYRRAGCGPTSVLGAVTSAVWSRSSRQDFDHFMLPICDFGQIMVPNRE